MSAPPSIILFSAMGGSGRLYDSIRPHVHNLITPDWIMGEPGETMAQYAARFARQLDPGVPCIVGGMSFGGMVAYEMASHLPCTACVLISAVRGPHQLPLYVRFLANIGRFLPIWCFSLSVLIARCLSYTVGWLLPFDRREFLRDYAHSHPAFLRWAIRALLQWKPTVPPAQVAIHQIHGTFDPIIFSSQTQSDTLVPRAQHFLPLSHPELISTYLNAIAANTPLTLRKPQ